MNKKARDLRGTDIGADLTFMTKVYDFKYACWKDAIRTSPIVMITHKKNLGVNVRVGPSEFNPRQAEVQFQPNDWVEVNRD